MGMEWKEPKTFSLFILLLQNTTQKEQQGPALLKGSLWLNWTSAQGFAWSLGLCQAHCTEQETGTERQSSQNKTLVLTADPQFQHTLSCNQSLPNPKSQLHD